MKKHIQIYLVVCDFDELPQTVVKRLNLQNEATDLKTKGLIAKGHRLPAKGNSFRIESQLPEENSLDLHALNILERVPKKVSEVENARLVLCVLIHIKDGDTTPISAIYLEKDTIAKMSKFKCGLDVDIYSYGV